VLGLSPCVCIADGAKEFLPKLVLPGCPGADSVRDGYGFDDRPRGVGGGSGGISEALLVPGSAVYTRLSALIKGDCEVPNGPVRKLRRPPELDARNIGDLGVRILRSARLPNACVSSAVGEARAGRFAISGTAGAAEVGRGGDGRPKLPLGSLWRGLCGSWCEGLRMLCTPSGLEGD
jgi:hypothetical protein